VEADYFLYLIAVIKSSPQLSTAIAEKKGIQGFPVQNLF